MREINDYIKRENAKRAVWGCARDTGIDEAPFEYAEGLLEDVPSEDVAPVRHGRWELNTDMTMHCSCCGELFRFDDKDECLDFMECAKYCIACGAKMDEVKDAE